MKIKNNLSIKNQKTHRFPASAIAILESCMRAFSHARVQLPAQESKPDCVK